MGSIYVICSRQCPNGDGIYTLLYALYKYSTSITNQPTNQPRKTSTSKLHVSGLCAGISPVWQHTHLHLNSTWLSWWRHQMETFSALLAICARNSPVTGEFPAQRPVTRSFDVFFDLRLNKRLSKQSRGWWLDTPSRPLWRHSNGYE